MGIPVGGTIGLFDPRNPTLLPNFDRSVASGSGTVDHESPAAFLAANPRVDAKATATVSGSATTGDIISLALTNPLFTNSTFNNPTTSLTETYTVQASDTVTTIAEQLADLFNATTICQNAGIYANVTGAVITFHHNGPVGNFSVLSVPTEEAAKIVVGGTALTGDVLAVLFTGAGLGNGVLITSNTTTSQSATTMAANLATAINANATLTALGISGSAATGTITMTVPAAAEPVYINSWVNTITPTATITGSVAAGDIMSLTVTNAAIAGGAVTVSYTALLGDTTTTIATAFKNLLNASAALIAAGITATSLTNAVTFLYQAANGPIRFSQSVSVGSETITLSTTPTETIIVGTAATELLVVGSGSTGVVAATATATVGGSSFVAADTVALTFTNAGVPGFPITVTYILGAGETATTIATGLKNLINTNNALQTAGVTATSATTVVTISQQGTIGNTTVLTRAITGTGNETVVFSNSGTLTGGAGTPGGAFTGGSGPIICVNNFSFARDRQTQAFFYGNAYNLGYNVITAMVNQGMSIV